MKTLRMYALLVSLMLLFIIAQFPFTPGEHTLFAAAPPVVKEGLIFLAILVVLISAFALHRQFRNIRPRHNRRHRRNRGGASSSANAAQNGGNAHVNAPAPQLQESPIEALFLHTWQQTYGNTMPLKPQHQIGKYCVDFAYLPTKVAIELDGFEGHSSTRQIERDRRRQRELETWGWRFIRFGGREVYYEPLACVRETHAFILRLQRSPRARR